MSPDLISILGRLLGLEIPLHRSVYCSMIYGVQECDLTCHLERCVGKYCPADTWRNNDVIITLCVRWVCINWWPLVRNSFWEHKMNTFVPQIHGTYFVECQAPLCQCKGESSSLIRICELRYYDNRQISNMSRSASFIKDLMVINKSQEIPDGLSRILKKLLLSWSDDELTHWGQDKMDAISQTTSSSAFSWMKMFEFRLKFQWSLFPRAQLTIFDHWFR